MENATTDQRGKPIIVGVDDGQPSQYALRWAVREAELRGVSVRVVAVDRGPARRTAGSLKEMFDAAVAYAWERLPAGRVEVLHAIGSPADVLLNESMDAELLVVGSRSRSALTSIAMGSVSNAVATHAICPVIVVRAGTSPVPQRIVVGVDGSESSERALAFAFEEAALRGLSLCVSHVWPPLQTDPDIRTSDREAVEREHRRSWLRQYATPYADKFPDVRLTVLVSDGRAAIVLSQQSRTAELVVVGSRGHGGLARLLVGSVSQGVLHHAHCSVAIIRGEGVGWVRAAAYREGRVSTARANPRQLWGEPQPR